MAKDNEHDLEVQFEGEAIEGVSKRGRGRPKNAPTHPEAAEIARSYAAMRREVRKELKQTRGAQVRANLLRQLQLLEQEERAERVKRGISPEKLNVAAIQGYKWIAKIGQAEPRATEAYSCCLRCILEVTYCSVDSIMAGAGSDNIITLLDQFVNSVTEMDLENVLEELRPFAREVWTKAVEAVAVAHKKAAANLDLQTKVATVDDIRAASAPTEEQMAEARDRFKNQTEAAQNAEKYGTQEPLKRTKDQISSKDKRYEKSGRAPAKNPIMR
jgi:hypothetical protein